MALRVAAVRPGGLGKRAREQAPCGETSALATLDAAPWRRVGDPSRIAASPRTRLPRLGADVTRATGVLGVRGPAETDERARMQAVR